MQHAARPFTALGWAAIVVAGVLGAAMIQRPSSLLVWIMAYLILVAGAGQYALGAGQARLSPPEPGQVWGQWALLNLGHAGIIGGTLVSRFSVVAAATVPYVLAVLWFAWRVRPRRGGALLLGYRAVLLVLLLSALIGVWLSALNHGHL